MNLYILWTRCGVKLACYAGSSDSAVAMAERCGYKVSSWDLGQIAETRGRYPARWITPLPRFQ